MKKKLSVTKVEELKADIADKIMREVRKIPQASYQLPKPYKMYIYDEYVSILGIKNDGEVITTPRTTIKPTIHKLPIYDLAELEDIINPI